MQTSGTPPGQTFWLWDPESCSFNQCPRDWSQSPRRERRVYQEFIVFGSHSCFGAAHSWKPLLNFAFGNSGLFRVSRGTSLWTSHKKADPLEVSVPEGSRTLVWGSGPAGFCWGRNRRGGVCPGAGDTSRFPAVLPRSSSQAGRTTCRSATSLGWAQPPTVATPPMAKALRATRWRTPGSSSGEAPGALFRAPEVVVQLSRVGLARGALPVAGGICRCPFCIQTSDQPRACRGGTGGIPEGHSQSEMMAEVGGPRWTPEATAVVSLVSPSSLPSSLSTL